MHTKTKGDIAEAMVAARLLQAGYVLLKPFGDNQRYDLVIDKAGKFLRVQCKMGRLKAGSIRFSTCSSTNKDTYEGQVEFFGVFCPETDGVYLVPIEDCNTSFEKSLRVEDSKNGQTAGTSSAEKYRIGRMTQLD